LKGSLLKGAGNGKRRGTGSLLKKTMIFWLIKNVQMQGARNPEEKGVPGRYVVDEG
jgi:hypothetical protein